MYECRVERWRTESTTLGVAACSRVLQQSTAVRLLVERRAIDPRFIEEQDVLATLDNRTNLMDLTQAEFESLITWDLTPS